MKKALVFILSIFLFFNLFSQSDSILSQQCGLRISLLTCSPGQELYSTFGHSALRVVDSAKGSDIIYNYGTFDFEDPAFYSKFTRGKLLYFVSLDRFENFVEEYRYEQRGIIEQVLNLSCTAKENLRAALQENAKEENKYYKYEFVEDNCTTRLRDIVFRNTNSPVTTNDIRPHRDATFRDLLHEYLDKSGKYWSKLGIDILLGSPVDKKLTNKETMFLPDYLLKGFDSSYFPGSAANARLVNEKKQILEPTMKASETSLLTPFMIFSLAFLIIAILSFYKKAFILLSVIDFILFFVAGALGLLVLFMWFGTDHPECGNNFNLAWAFPLHFIMIFFFFQKWNWIRYYFLVNSIILLLLLVLWEWLPQEINNALIPVVSLLLLRSFVRYKKNPGWKKNSNLTRRR